MTVELYGCRAQWFACILIYVEIRWLDAIPVVQPTITVLMFSEYWSLIILFTQNVSNTSADTGVKNLQCKK